MKIAILGAKGFLGSYLTKFLSPNHSIIPVNRDTVNLENYSAVNQWLLDAKPDSVINCAISGGGTKVNDINYSDVQRDLNIFLNFYNSSIKFKYINIGSGAEFDRRQSITNAEEHEILYSKPLESYSFTKNVIARMCLSKENFYTLRLFGCFDSSEPNIRLFKKYLSNSALAIEDKFFDFISAADFAKIVEAYCVNDDLPKDINCVYKDKYRLSSILMKLRPDIAPNIVKESNLHYTGSGSKLAELPIALAGLAKGLKEYE